MPRIDPLQLLKCLSVLLSPDGGILSRDEVPRLVNLMTKFSKKLVSKCVYVLILKNTETSLVDMFMAEGGWTLIQTWLQDAAQSGNWDLVKEILGLLLITPVDVERLKMNCLPKLIKNLSRREDLGDVAHLSNQIVQNWLIIVKGSAHGSISASHPVQAQPENKEVESVASSMEIEESCTRVTNSSVSKEEHNETDNGDTLKNDQAINANTFYKVSVKDGKQVIRKLSLEGDKSSSKSESEESNKSDENKEDKDNRKEVKSSEKEKDKSSKSSSSSRSKSSSSSREKDRDKEKKKSSRSSSSKSKSSSSSSKDKDKDKKDKERDRRDKDKDRSKHSSSSRSSSKSSSKDNKDSKDKNKSNDLKDSKDPKETKEKQAEKDKDTLEKLKPQMLDKLGRIPKKSGGSSSEEKQKENKPKENLETKKPSFSILNRKATGDERTKTVKVFNSKMRSTGLEEEVKPPPPRSVKKPTPSVQLPTIPPKRPSPPRELSTMMPPEKKLKIDKIDIPDRPGAIKLIPPKPKPAVLQESDMFMDALTAAAPKKEAKKRKRRASVSKDTPNSPSSSPVRGEAQTPTSPTPSSPTASSLGLKNIAPINFYQDTLSEEPEKSDDDKNENNSENNKETESNTNSPENADTPASPPTPTDVDVAMENEDTPVPPKQIKLEGGLKGVLLYAKKKGPKRSIKWRAEEDLVEIRYFELDETERVNVTKTFMDMAKMELNSEREALIMSRKLPNEDVMEPQTMWRMMYICEQPDSLIIPGSKSLEKDIQFAREKSVPPALYFDKRRIPDSSEEPIPENHQMSDPVIIPLEDPESQEIDLRSTPWPEPKGPAPQIEPQPMPPIFPNMPFNPGFNNMGNMPPGPPFVGVPPRFVVPPGPHGPIAPGPGNFVPPNMMHNNMMGPPMNQPDMMNPGPMIPGAYGPGPEGFMGPGSDPGYPMQQFNGPQGPNMNMYGPNNFNHRGGGGGRGGGYRRGGGNNGGWVQLNGPRNWKRGGGGGPRGGRMCKNIQNHGYCRNGDNCPFVH